MQVDHGDASFVHTSALSRPQTPAEVNSVQRVMDQFPPGSLVTIQWISTTGTYDEEEHGIELDTPEPAIVLRHVPEHAFMSVPKGWVIPFECIYQGSLRLSTTYAAEVLEHAF